MVQKNATPCDGPRDSVGAAARDMDLRAPNAAMMEKSAPAGHDVPGPRATAVAQAGALAIEAKTLAL
eukprot:3251090-Pyramimonas_sp.AAC.1